MSDFKKQITALKKDVKSLSEKLQDPMTPPSQKVPFAKELKAKKDEIKVLYDKIEVAEFDAKASAESE